MGIFGWGWGSAKNLNTVNLFGDLDEVELVQEIEAAFRIKFDPLELDVHTVGELETVVRKKLETSDVDLTWALLKQIVQEYARPKGRAVNRDSTLFAARAKERMNHG